MAIISIEAEKLKQQIEQQKQSVQKEQEIKELKCANCDRWIIEGEDKHYYYCTLHNTIFCDRCAKNYYHTDINVNNAVHCEGWKLDAIHGNDCFYEKRFLKLKEVSNDN